MVVVNLDNRPYHLWVNDVECMKNHGEDGSNLDIWNNVTIDTISAIPPFGQPLQYIEADGTFPSCAFEQSHFAIQFDQHNGFNAKAGINIQTSPDGVPVDPRYVEGSLALGLSATQNFSPWGGQPGIGILHRPSYLPSKYPFDQFDPAQWMGQMLQQHPEFRAKQLNIVALPASHDSGMSQAGPCTSFGNARVTQTQTLALAQQLEAGVRYFDLRPALWSVNDPLGEFTFGHFTTAFGGQGCMGESMVPALNNVKTFLDDHPNEIVIMKFSGFIDSDGNKFSVSNQQTMIEKIKSCLDGQMLSMSEGEKVGLYTIGKIIEGEKRAICVFQNLDSSLVDPSNGILLFGALDCNSPGSLPTNYYQTNFDLFDCYSDSENSVLTIADQIAKYRRFQGARLLNGELFLLSHTLTLGTVDNTPLGANISILELAKHINELLWDVVTSIYPGKYEGRQLRPPNLVYVDAVNDEHPILAALYLNTLTPSPMRLPRIAIMSTVSANVYLRLNADGTSGSANCQVGIGAFERFALESGEGDNSFYLKSVEFGVYLTLDGEGATDPSPSGVGRSGSSTDKVPEALFRVHANANGTFAIESARQPNLFLRMDGQNVVRPSPSGGGLVNGQIGAGPLETFVFGAA